jgi:hypothetical protein
MTLPRFRVKTVLSRNGERLPMLIGPDGLPLFGPTLFSLTEIRARNRATNTISNSLRGIMVFYLFLELNNIDLGKRLAEGRVLAIGEIEDLVRLCRLYKHERIRHAFELKKRELTAGISGPKRGTSPQLQIALDRIGRLEAENRRLESENNMLLEQFARWAYNAHTRGLDQEFLNRPLPSVNRGQTKK